MQVHLLTIVDQASFDAQLHESVWTNTAQAEDFALSFRANKVAADPDWYQSFDNRRYGESIAYTIVAYDVRETN
jgi:hypothetical protein